MTYEDKVNKLARAIIEAKKMATDKDKVELDQHIPLIEDLNAHEIKKLLHQFAHENIIDLIDEDIKDGGYVFIFNIKDIKALSNKRIISMDDYDNALAPLRVTRLVKEANEQKSKSQESKQKFFIEFNAERKIMLNGKLDLAKPDFGGDNEAIFLKLYDNPFQEFSKKELEKMIGGEIKSLDKVVENLGFRRGLKSAFFDIKGDKIRFKNPVTF